VFLHRTLDGFTTPKILDFGISKLMSKTERSKEWAQETTIGTILGSPAYMSPEQTAAEDLDPRADVWSLGVVLYRALSGEFPFVAANFTTLMLAINTQDPKPLEERVPGLPRELYALVGKCLSRRRSDRYASAGALADAIDRVMEQHELPVLELSQVVGEAAPLPSEHMKTQSFQAGSTLPFGVTTPTRTKKVTEGTTTVTESTREVVENEPQIVDNISPIDAMASAPVPVAVLGTSTSKEPRRRAPFAIAALVALLAIGFFGLRARTSTDAPVAASAPPPAAKPIETMAAPVAPSVSVTSVGTSVGAAAPPSASVKSDVPKVGAPIKKTPPAIKSKPPQGPHEGLVRPGF
jgi:serine/threonine-protein kinase